MKHAQKMVCSSYTKNYTPVLIEGDKDMCGKIVKAKIEKVDGEYCIASII